MKKKKLLKRIEELERRNTQLENKYKRVLFEDDKRAILMERFIYKQNEKHEQLMLKGLSSGMIEFKTPEFKRNSLDPRGDEYNWSKDISYGYMCVNDEAPRLNKNCKECKLKKELTTAFNIISLDDNIFDIKSRPKIEVKIFSNLVQRHEK